MQDNNDTVSIKEVKTADELAQAQRIRQSVLEAEQGFAHDVNVDGRDARADHVLMLDGGDPVGTARLTEVGPGKGMIARIAVLASHRGQGLGEHLIRALESAARRRGFRSVHLQPHARLERFFRALGYTRDSAALTHGRHSLIRMTKKLSP